MMPSSTAAPNAGPLSKKTLGQRVLDQIERIGNRLPDPAALFVLTLLVTMILSAALAPVRFTEIDPRTVVKDAAGNITASGPIRVKSQLTGDALTLFFTRMVKTFVEFPPLGVVLVTLLGVGVAEQTGLISAALKAFLAVTARKLLTPMVVFVALISHSAVDAGYVLVVPLGGIIFAAAGRHPLAGIAAAFAGVSGGFSANFVPSSLDPLLQGFTQSAAQILAPGRTVNPLCNWYFCAASSVLVIAVGWFLTDRVVEPRLRRTTVDADADIPTGMGELNAAERRGLWAAGLVTLAGVAVVAWFAFPASSPLRNKEGSLTGHGAPLMDAIVPLIFLLFLIPGAVYGYVARTIKSHRDLVAGMSKAMVTMAYYLVISFAAALFTYAFRESNLGALVAVKGAAALKALQLPPQFMIIGVILLTTLSNLLVASASAKWALLGPILVPMLMQLGLAPELTQAAYRVGDSCTNIVTPLMVYFPLIVVNCQRYVKQTGIGTLVSLMLPYSFVLLVTWTLLLLAFWGFGLPLGLQSAYTYP